MSPSEAVMPPSEAMMTPYEAMKPPSEPAPCWGGATPPPFFADSEKNALRIDDAAFPKRLKPLRIDVAAPQSDKITEGWLNIETTTIR